MKNTVRVLLECGQVGPDSLIVPEAGSHTRFRIFPELFVGMRYLIISQIGKKSVTKWISLSFKLKLLLIKPYERCGHCQTMPL